MLFLSDKKLNGNLQHMNKYHKSQKYINMHIYNILITYV